MKALIEEPAFAKINLTLRVLGRRPDGYHELESLVVFAAQGDRIALAPGEPPGVSVSGPFASSIEGENLVAAALRLLGRVDPPLRLGAVTLEKNLPVAAGLGGGSADAAAVLRAVRLANPGRRDGVDWCGMARQLGADVPVCLESRPALMWGIGHDLTPLRQLPEIALVLANPGVPLSSREVFQSLACGEAAARTQQPISPGAFRDVTELAAYLRTSSNDLEAPAAALCPEAAVARSALAAMPGVLLARMSGSGPTAFALFATRAQAGAAAHALKQHQPHWWVAATRTRAA